MPEAFSVHIDPDILVRPKPAVPLPGLAARRESDGIAEQHHGARDGRLAARQRSERDHAGRASGAGGGRSYAFRRS
jgi:hypothetical protein